MKTTIANPAFAKTAFTKKRLRGAAQRGQQAVEFLLVAIVFIPALMGMFIVGWNMIRTIQTKEVVRDLDSLYIKGTDFSTYPAQQLAQRLASGLDLQMPSFSGNSASNTAAAGSGIIIITQLMYVGATTGGQCASVGAANCTNHDSFVFTQRIEFGSSTWLGTHPSSLGEYGGSGSTALSSQGAVPTPLTNTNAKLSAAGQGVLNSDFQSNNAGQTDIVDGQYIYVVEGYFDTPAFSLGNLTSQGVYSRFYF